MMNQYLGSDFSVQFLPPFLRKLPGLFIRPIREVNEMNYQFLHTYEMDDNKFCERFPHFEVTSYSEGIASMITWFQEHGKGRSNI